MAGARRSPTAASKIDGVRPSTTIRTTFCDAAGLLVTRKRAESCIALRHPPAETRGERRNERRDPEARAAATKRPGDDLRRSERAEHTTRSTAHGLVPLAEPEPDQEAGAPRQQECDGKEGAGSAEQAGDKDA